MKRHCVLPFGAALQPDQSCVFRLWAPDADRVTLVLETAAGRRERLELTRDELNAEAYARAPGAGAAGWRSVRVADVGAGARYRFRIDDEIDVPDPASRFNPEGAHEASEVIDPTQFEWSDAHWRGRPWHEAVVYELHVGSFTPEGTFAAIVPRLAQLVELGITAIELLPIATFPGERGWGYDGVLPFAPHPAYGRPEDLKHLIQAAHQLHLSVLLDVVYNHFGPDGNYLPRYARRFFTERYRTPWGDAINFEGDDGRNVRQFFLENARYWLEEYRFDGLRLDAVHAIHDESPEHFIDELARSLAAGPGRDRHVHLVLENADNEARRLRAQGGKPSRAQWNDDFHHAMHVIVTGETDGYYMDYARQPLEQLGRVLTQGFAFQGEPFEFSGRQPRGERSVDLPVSAFVNFLQNHDQVGNRACGERLVTLVSAPRLRAALSVLLLAPQTPMLFMGEEYGAAQPFLYFCDYRGALAEAIVTGRRAEFAGFGGFSDEQARERIPDPNAPATFIATRMDWSERDLDPHRDWLEFVRALLALRRQHVVPLIEHIAPGRATHSVAHAVLTATWSLDPGGAWKGGALKMVANLGDVGSALASSRGSLIFSSARSNSPDLQPWEVRLLRLVE